MIRQAIAIALLGVFGVIKMPAEKSLDAAQRQAGLRGTALNLDLREQVGQLSFLAALSGFRSPTGCLSLDRSPQCMGTNRVGPHGCAFRCGNHSSAPVPPLLGYGRVAHGLEREHSRAPGTYSPARPFVSATNVNTFGLDANTLSGASRTTRRASFSIAAWQFSCATNSRIIAGPAKLSSRPRSFLGLQPISGGLLVMNWRSARVMSKRLIICSGRSTTQNLADVNQCLSQSSRNLKRGWMSPAGSA